MIGISKHALALFVLSLSPSAPLWGQVPGAGERPQSIKTLVRTQVRFQARDWPILSGWLVRMGDDSVLVTNVWGEKSPVPAGASVALARGEVVSLYVARPGPPGKPLRWERIIPGRGSRPLGAVQAGEARAAAGEERSVGPVTAPDTAAGTPVVAAGQRDAATIPAAGQRDAATIPAQGEVNAVPGARPDNAATGIADVEKGAPVAIPPGPAEVAVGSAPARGGSAAGRHVTASRLVGRWVRVERGGLQPLEGRVLRCAGDTLIRARLGDAADSVDVAVSNASRLWLSTAEWPLTERGRKVGAVVGGLVGIPLGYIVANQIGLKAYPPPDMSAPILGLLVGVPVGCVVGVLGGRLWGASIGRKTIHHHFEPVALPLTATVQPTGDGRLAVGVRLRR